MKGKGEEKVNDILHMSHDEFNEEVESSVVLEDNRLILLLGREQLNCWYTSDGVACVSTRSQFVCTWDGIVLDGGINSGYQDTVFILEGLSKFIPNGFKFLTIAAI